MINHLWQSTVFAILAAILTLAFRKNRAQIRYWIWFSASLKFLIPFSLLISLGSYVKWTPAAKTTATPAVALAITQITQPFSDTASFVSSSPARADWTPVALLAVWACGFAMIALMRLRGWLRVRAAVRSSSPMDIPVPVNVRSSPGLLEPGVVGFLRPILLLPEGIAECLTPRQLEAVLAHELCHVRRRDNLTSAIHMIVEVIFWFHPLVWWIGARLVDERERACDEAVLSLGSEPHVYAEAILNVCKSYLESPLRCVSGVTGSDLKKRIQAILTGRLAGELNFAKRVALAVVGITALALPIIVGILNAPAIRAQSAVAPKFEVATIKRSVSGTGSSGSSSAGGRFWRRNHTLRDLIKTAYGVETFQISGGPNWINSDHYDIEAKAEGNPPPERMEGPMLETLLGDRFQLKLHRETKETRVYALSVEKHGLKLKRSTCEPFDVNHPPSEPAPGERPNVCGFMNVRGNGPNVTLDFIGRTMPELAGILSPRVSRTVIDKTGITGNFDGRLEYASEQPGDSAGGPSIFTAVREQLGLKLEPSKGPGEFLVIDHVERPTEN